MKAVRIGVRGLATLCLVVLALPATGGWAAPVAAGDLDPSFGVGGKVLTRFGGWNARAAAAAIQPDGRIVVVGRISTRSESWWALARYDPDGTLDPSFGEGGRVVADFVEGCCPHAVAIQADGKIVVAGGVLARFNSDGTLDTTFGATGVAEGTGVHDLAIQVDGRIVAAGTFDGTSGLARFDPDGTLDPTLMGDGAIEAVVWDLAVQPDGRIVTIADAVITRYTVSGAVDLSFGGGDGTVGLGSPTWSAEYVFKSGDVALQPDGKIVAPGRAEDCSGGPGPCDYYNMLVRFDPAGTRDATFGPYGAGNAPWGRPWPKAIQFDGEGRVLVVGAFANGRFSVTRLNADGSRDQSFGDLGTQHTRFTPYRGAASAIAIQADDRIVVVGTVEGAHRSTFALARFLG
jgi:uncharacterized delta-60 repeat protein